MNQQLQFTLSTLVAFLSLFALLAWMATNLDYTESIIMSVWVLWMVAIVRLSGRIERGTWVFPVILSVASFAALYMSSLECVLDGGKALTFQVWILHVSIGLLTVVVVSVVELWRRFTASKGAG